MKKSEIITNSKPDIWWDLRSSNWGIHLSVTNHNLAYVLDGINASEDDLPEIIDDDLIYLTWGDKDFSPSCHIGYKNIIELYKRLSLGGWLMISGVDKTYTHHHHNIWKYYPERESNLDDISEPRWEEASKRNNTEFSNRMHKLFIPPINLQLIRSSIIHHYADDYYRQHLKANIDTDWQTIKMTAYQKEQDKENKQMLVIFILFIFVVVAYKFWP